MDAPEVEPFARTGLGRHRDRLFVEGLGLVERAPLPQQPRQQHDDRAQRRLAGLAGKRRARQPLRARNVARVAPVDGEVGDREVVVGPELDRALERLARLVLTAEGPQRVAEIVVATSIARIERHHPGECGDGALGVPALAAQDPELLVRGDEARLQRHRALEAGDGHGGRGVAFVQLGCRVMGERILGIRHQCLLDVPALRGLVAAALRAGRQDEVGRRRRRSRHRTSGLQQGLAFALRAGDIACGKPGAGALERCGEAAVSHRRPGS